MDVQRSNGTRDVIYSDRRAYAAVEVTSNFPALPRAPEILIE